MQFELMGAFRDRDGDDEFSKRLRVLRAGYYGVVAGAFWLMLQTVLRAEYLDKPPADAVVGAAIFSIFTFVTVASSERFRRPYVLPAVMLLALVAGEVTTSFGLWDLKEVLGWWRMAILLAAAACCFLWAGEKGVQLRRSRREGLGNPG